MSAKEQNSAGKRENRDLEDKSDVVSKKLCVDKLTGKIDETLLKVIFA